MAEGFDEKSEFILYYFNYAQAEKSTDNNIEPLEDFTPALYNDTRMTIWSAGGATLDHDTTGDNQILH